MMNEVGKTEENTKFKYKIILLGHGIGIGKSALANRYAYEKFVAEYDPTIEDEHKKDTKIDEEECTVCILDTAGEEEAHLMRFYSINHYHGFVLTYSVTSKRSFDDLNFWYDYVIKATAVRGGSAAIVIAGTKSDDQINRVISSTQAKEFSQKMNIPLFETSSKNGENVEEVFEEVVRLIRKDPNFPFDNLDALNNPPFVPKKKKCLLQ